MKGGWYTFPLLTIRRSSRLQLSSYLLFILYFPFIKSFNSIHRKNRGRSLYPLIQTYFELSNLMNNYDPDPDFLTAKESAEYLASPDDIVIP